MRMEDIWYSEIKHDGWEMGMDNVDMGHGGTSKVVRLLMVSRVRVKRCVWCMRRRKWV